MATLFELIQQFRSEIPQFISTDIVEIETGMSIAGGSVDPTFDSSAASACYAEVVKSNSRALDIMGIGAGNCEDILITTKGAFLLLRMIGPRHYHGVAITRQGTLGYARTIMQKYAPMILQALPK